MAMSKFLKSARSAFNGVETSSAKLHDALVGMLVAVAADNRPDVERFAEFSTLNVYMDEVDKTDYHKRVVRSWLENVCKFRVKGDGTIRPKRGLEMNQKWLDECKATTWYAHGKEITFKVPEVSVSSLAGVLAKRALAGEEPNFDAVMRELKSAFETAKGSTNVKTWFATYTDKVSKGEVQPLEAA